MQEKKIILIFSFVLVNMDESRARSRFENLPDGQLWPKSGMLSAYEELAIYHRGREEPNIAINYFSMFLKIDSTNPRIYTSAAHVYDLMGDRNNHVKYLEKALELSPSNWEILLELGSAYGSLGMHDAAYTYLKKAAALNPMSSVLSHALGVAVLNLNNDCIKAANYFSRSIALDSSYADSYAGLAYCAARKNDIISAREYKKKYLQFKKQSSSSPEIQRMLDGIQ